MVVLSMPSRLSPSPLILRFFRAPRRGGPSATVLILFPFVLIITLSILVTTSVLYLFFTNSTAQMLSQRTLEGLHSSRAVFSRIHLGSFPSFLHLDEDPDIQDFLAGPLSKVKALKALVKLDKVVNENSLVDSVFLYNQEAGVLSNRAGWEAQPGRTDPGLPNLLEKIRQIGRGRYIPRSVAFGGNPEKVNLYTIIFGNLPSGGSAMRKAVVVNLSETRIRALLEPRNADELSRIVILDQRNGIILTHPDGGSFAKDITADPLMATIALEVAPEGSRRLDSPAGPFILTWSDQVDMGWRFVSVSAEATVFGPLRSIRDLTLLVAFVVLLASVGFALVAAILLGRQITHQDQVRLFLRNDSLDSPNPNPDRLFGSSGPWVVSLVKLDGYRRLGQKSGEARARQQADRLWYLALRIYGTTAVCRVEEHLLMVLDRPAPAGKGLDRLIQAFSQEKGPTLSLFRYPPAVPNAELPQVWQQLSHANLASFSQPTGLVHDLDPAAPRLFKELGIDQLDLSRYEQALRQDNGQEASRILDLLLDLVATCGNPETFRYLATTLGYRTLHVLGADADLLLEQGAEGLRRDLSTAENLQEVRSSLGPVFLTLGNRSELHNSQRQREIIRRIKTLVETSLTDRSLGTAKIAKSVGLSAHYVRDIFKQLEGQSLSNWVGQRRIEEACRLLRETNDSVRLICDATGFINYSYFFTYFKKVTGQTPNEYREQTRE